MSEIFVLVSGNGIAWVDNAYPWDGDTVTLTAQPDLDATLDDITARESHGWAVALATTTVQTFTYDDSWGDLTIYVTFSGGSPPPPPPPEIPAWLIGLMSKKNQEKRK